MLGVTYVPRYLPLMMSQNRDAGKVCCQPRYIIKYCSIEPRIKHEMTYIDFETPSTSLDDLDLEVTSDAYAFMGMNLDVVQSALATY